MNYCYLKSSITCRRSLNPVIGFFIERVLIRLILLFIFYSLIYCIPPPLLHHCCSFLLSIRCCCVPSPIYWRLAPCRCHVSTPNKSCLRVILIDSSIHFHAHPSHPPFTPTPCMLLPCPLAAGFLQ